MKAPKTYNDILHRNGRIFLSLGLSVMLLVPFTIWLVTGQMPDSAKLLEGFIALSILQLPGGIVEVATYGPMLGTSATYLAFVTGNLSNLKIPCAMNARQLCNTEIGTPENEVVSTLAVSASTITTVVIMGLGVIMLIPLSPLLNNPVLQPAFNWVVSALFGALGYKYFRGNLKLVIVPLVVMVVLGLVAPGFVVSTLSIAIIIGAVVSVIAAKIMFDKKWL
ncbi:MAG: hypothetical protein WC479_05540 [Candidatus Izemoplasmatales bacterium]|jgi:hypothetical protein|nr:hypothetical protein [Candidatus Izemoplasmatales bacterium]MDD3865649.1 hypothetical protein [Candidatus Izemoplasmatales bacterium]